MTHSYGNLAISITASAIAFSVPFLMLYIFTAPPTHGARESTSYPNDPPVSGGSARTQGSGTR